MTPTFTTAAELRAHYAGVRAKFDAAREPVAPNRKRTIWLKPPPQRIDARQKRSPTTGALQVIAAARRAEMLDELAELDRQRMALADRLGVEIDSEAPRRTATQILIEVALKHLVTVTDLKSVRRSVPIVRARHEAFWRLRQETSMSMPQIGKRMGGRDHTTVLHGIRKHQARLDAGEAR